MWLPVWHWGFPDREIMIKISSLPAVQNWTEAATFENRSNTSLRDKELLNLVPDVVDNVLQLGRLVGGDGAGDDRAGNAAGSAQRHLGRHEHVRHVLVLAQQGEVQQNLEGLSVSSHDNQLADTTVQGLGSCCDRKHKQTQSRENNLAKLTLAHVFPLRITCFLPRT